jgi:F-type H+-transporting ATPase subunit b
MDKLLQPDTGLMIWTLVTFFLVVFILSKTAWKPIISGLNAREGKIKSDLERAEKSQKDAEELRLKFEAQLTQAQKTIQDMMKQARDDAEKSRAHLVESAKAEAERIMQKGRQELAGETEKLKAELQQDVVGLSVAIAEKLLQKSVDQKVQETVLKESFKNLSGVGR